MVIALVAGSADRVVVLAAAPRDHVEAGADLDAACRVQAAQRAHQPQFEAVVERFADEGRHVDRDNFHDRADGVAVGAHRFDKRTSFASKIRVEGCLLYTSPSPRDRS